MRQRSEDSLAFEELWRSRRTSGLPVPGRYDFHSIPSKFRPNIVMIQAPGEDRNSLKIVTSGRYLDSVSYLVPGTDYLDLLPIEYRSGAIASVRLIVDMPCGLWQLMPVYFPRSGYGGVAEATVFPLAAGADGIPLIVALFHPVNELIGVPKTSHPVMAIDTAVKFRFIDIGAGVPT